MKLVEHLGSGYTLAAVLTLEELGIDRYPVTAAGKVRKNILKELVSQHFGVAPEQDNESFLNGKSTEPLTPQSSKRSDIPGSVNLEPLSLNKDASEIEETIQQLIEIWATLVVISPSKDDPILDFADSITLLRYCDKVWRSLGKKLYLQDFIVHETIGQQAQLLQSRDAIPKEAAGAGMHITLEPLSLKVLLTFKPSRPYGYIVSRRNGPY